MKLLLTNIHFFESRVSGATEHYQGGKNFAQRRLRGFTTWKDMLKECVDSYCELANKKTERCLQSLKSLLG